MSQPSPHEFINAYNGLLDELSWQNPSRLFWATDFASKNRFSCPLPDILEGMSDGHIVDARLKRMIGVFYHACALAVRMLKARRFLKQIDTAKTYTVIKTFIYDHSFAKDGRYKDVFFGALPEHLKQQGKNVLVYAYVLGNYDQCLRNMALAGIPIVPVEAFLRFEDLCSAVRELLLSPIKVPTPLVFKEKDVSALVRQYLDRSFKGVQLRQFIQYWTARNLAGRLRVDAFYMTYENYPWERMAIRALREVSPATKTIGIQHTVVPQAFLNYFTSVAEVKERLLPDEVLTTGQATADIIRRYSTCALPAVKAGCALRFEHIHQIPAAKQRPVKNILLALEASLKTGPMLHYVLGQIKDDLRYQIKVRTHPLLPWNVIERQLGVKVPSNLTISNASLKEDLQWADALIYWSTTVSMEALMMGKPVIHFDAGGILSFDPLFECPHLKWKVKQGLSLAHILSEINSLSPTQFAKAQADARQYLTGYFHPVDPQTLSQL